MRTFEIGKIYKHGWIGDAELFTSWEVIARTKTTITIKCLDRTAEVKKVRINPQLTEWNKAESVKPFGTYSMAPTLTA